MITRADEHPPLPPEFEMQRFATVTAQKAGDILLSHFERIKSVTSKDGAGNIKTEADQASEDFITSEIHKLYPNHSIVGEEGTLQISEDSPYTWSVDPLDGTLPFASGLPAWSVSIGLLKDQQPIMGVVHFPLSSFGQEETYTAIKGQGAFVNGKRLQVSSESKLSNALVGFDYGYHNRVKRIQEVLLKVAPEVRYTLTEACATRLLADLAAGKLGGYLHSGLEHWDIAAITTIITEAGGEVTDLKGKPIVWEDGKQFDFLATNGKLHGALLKLVS